MNDLAAMTTFVAVARAESFAGAARRLGRSTTATSRHVAELERSLGVTLLRRTTRRITLTEAGARYLSRAATILEEVDRLRAETAGEREAPRGALRISAPPAIGRDLVTPLAVDFVAAFPEIDLELSLSEWLVDLVAEGYDAALRAGPMPNSSLISHRIVELDYRLCASPDYLLRRGTPGEPADLIEHDCLSWPGADPGLVGIWSFSRAGTDSSAHLRFRFRVSDLSALHIAVLRGLGLAVLPSITVNSDIAAGRLVEVLPQYRVPSGPLSLVRPAAPFEPAKLRAFIDFMTDAIRRRVVVSRAVV